MRPAFHKGRNGKSAYKNKEKKEKQSEEEESQLAASHKCHLKKNEAEVLMKM